MDSDNGGLSSPSQQRQTAAEIARKKVLAAYSSTMDTVQRIQPDWSHQAQPQTTDNYQRTAIYSQPSTTQNYQNYQSYTAQPAETQPNPAITNENANTLKDTSVNQEAINAEWAKYHSAWQDYYKKYYSEYYAKAAQNYLATEKMKSERIATGEVRRQRNLRHLVPIISIATFVLLGLFLQYNRLIFAPIMAYVSPDTGSVNTSLEAVDPTVSQTVSPEPRLIIPKLNVDVPVEFGIETSSVDEAMNRGVAQFSIPGANALPGQIGNLAISGHSAGDIYSSNPYKFIFSGLERLEVGDLIYINYNSVRYTYQMLGSEVVEPTDVASLIYDTDKPMLTLITCTPLGTSRYRLLITAEQISPAYSTDDIATEEPTPAPEGVPTTNTDSSMPANEPSFFENLWNKIFGN